MNKFELNEKVLYKGFKVLVYDYSIRYKTYTISYDDRHVYGVDESELTRMEN